MSNLLAALTRGLGVLCAVMMCEAHAASSELVGVWKVVAFQSEKVGGDVQDMYGESPLGMIIYSENGHMSAQAVQSELPKCGTTDRRMCPDKEARRAYDGYMGYWGKYEVDEATKTIVHVLEGASVPDMIGMRLKRFYSLKGSKLVIRTPPQHVKGVEVVVVVTLERAQ